MSQRGQQSVQGAHVQAGRLGPGPEVAVTSWVLCSCPWPVTNMW